MSSDSKHLLRIKELQVLLDSLKYRSSSPAQKFSTLGSKFDLRQELEQAYAELDKTEDNLHKAAVLGQELLTRLNEDHDRIESLKLELTNRNGKLLEAEMVVAKKDKELLSLEKQLVTLRAKSETLEHDNYNLTVKNEDISGRLNRVRLGVRDSVTKDLHQDIKESMNMLDDLRLENSQLKEGTDKKSRQIENMQRQLQESGEKLRMSNEQLQSCEVNYGVLQEKLVKAEQIIHRLEVKQAALVRERDDCRADAASLEEELYAVRNIKTLSQALQSPTVTYHGKASASPEPWTSSPSPNVNDSSFRTAEGYPPEALGGNLLSELAEALAEARQDTALVPAVPVPPAPHVATEPEMVSQSDQFAAAKEYFAMTVMACKLNMPRLDLVVGIESQELYQQMIKEEVPFHGTYSIFFFFFCTVAIVVVFG
jgi:myosin heavy subunit